ncbi:Zinc finger A20 and AN1 domain-containing stress-associated protein 8 [Capsicum chinense]|nr:Zinc finger A20 and AN1 domain-containing stress-associated protein 8 [Capsicum chinense]
MLNLNGESICSSLSEDKVLAESVDSVDDEPLFPEPDRDLSDCDTSLSTRRSCRELIHNFSGQALPVEDGFSVSHFLLNEHEIFSSSLWMAFEYLDSKFSPISDSGFRTCTKLPSSMTKEILIADIIDEVEEWTRFVGLIPDELIEWDMSHSLGKCTDFEIEEYECGTEVARHILQELVDEVVLDLYRLHNHEVNSKISNPKRWEVHLGLVLNVDSQLLYHNPMVTALHTQYIFCTGVPHGGPAFHAAGTEMEPSKETGCRAPEDPVLCINDCDFFCSAATMNMCSKCQKDMILLKQEHAKLAAASRKASYAEA